MPFSLVGQTIGNYALESALGDGGMAQVYKARHVHLGSLHAVKVLDPELLVHADIRERFLSEGRIQAQLRHPNIVAVTELLSEPGIAALVMEFVDGPSLASWVERQPGFPDAAVLKRLFGQILAGLGHAHEHGVIHRDIKPANILLRLKDGVPVEAKLLDFGIAKVDAGGKGKTRTNARLGTPDYMSPEQIVSTKDVDLRTDIYSLGVALYECATKALPFEGDSEFDIQTAIIAGRRTPVRERNPAVDRAIEAAIEKALQPTAAARFADCAAFAAGLEMPAPLRVDEKPPQVPARPADAVATRRTTQRWPAVAGVLGVAGIVVALVANRSERSTGSQPEESRGAAARPVVSTVAPVGDSLEPVRTSDDRQWIIALGAFATSADVDKYIREVSPRADGPLSRLWIPDYGSLSGARMFVVYLGPFPYSERADVLRRVIDARRLSPGAYGLKLASSGPRETLSP